MSSKTNNPTCMPTEYVKLMNQKDGSQKYETFPIPDGLLSDKPTLLLCSECEQKGIRTKIWKEDTLYICLNKDCGVRYYWDGGIYWS